jgi:hypothetical protein
VNERKGVQKRAEYAGENGRSVICVAIWRNLRNLLTIEKAGTNGPQITLITLIMDAHNLSVVRTCGRWPHNETTGRA